MKLEYIETEHLLLRKFDEAILKEAVSIYNDDDLGKFLGMDPAALAKEKVKIGGGFSTFNKKYLAFHLMDKETKEVIGSCGYHTWYIDHNRAEIGYSISEKYRKKGLMKEAMTAVLLFGLNDMNLNRIDALIATYNVPSLKLATYFGFKQEGVLKEHYLVNGIFEDSVLFALLKSNLPPFLQSA